MTTTKTATELKIEKAIQKISKLETKMERIEVALAGGKNPYCYGESDKRRTASDLRHAQAKLEELQLKREKEIEEFNSRVPVVEQFLDMWEERAIEFYKAEHEQLKAFDEDFYARRNAFREQKRAEGYKVHSYSFSAIELDAGLGETNRREQLSRLVSSVTIDANRYGSDWFNRILSVVAREKASKRRMLMQRVQKKVGQITDATGLYIADNGEINGFVTGTDSTVEVRTIYAGGYNIQCLHFRVLVK